MAHHNNTPQRILDAPTVKPETVSRQAARSRSERRHGIVIPQARSGNPMATTMALLAAAAEKPNAPVVGAKKRKVRRGRKARWNR